MADNSIYSDIAKRTGGDIYVGVVGPVRTGKSTFIHRFIDTVVLPGIENEDERQRALDEIPQSATGRTIMTTEPKFVPDESVRICVGDGTALNVKLIDCVGYMVEGALGAEEDGSARMVMTPWSEVAMPFTEAAELGTSKVIGEHSTIGMLVTTDGTIGEIPRESYIPAEERVAEELRELGKPFAIVLNSKYPESDAAHTLAAELEEKYRVPVALVSCPELDADDIREILGLVLGEFPLRSLSFSLPTWCEALPEEHPVRAGLYEKIDGFVSGCEKLGDVRRALSDCPDVILTSLDAGDGTGELSLPLSDEVYYETLSEVTGLDISDESTLFSTMKNLAEVKDRYEKIESALLDAEDKGYGIVMPKTEELSLEEPRAVKQASGWGVRVAAHASSIHMIKTGIRTEVCPVVGTEEQADEVVKYLTEELGDNPAGIWECNMFGKSLRDLVSDGMTAKLEHMPEPSREKLGETLERIINEGSNGLICILL
ncbi:MAG: stage IV sporulation protein A [Clostridia bacterium]|nr:stage IV sporulation protein A [Clostridia bacterium]